jgi:epoxyqueuosine reductase
MPDYDHKFIGQMKERLDLDLLGVAPIDNSSPIELKDCAQALMPTATSALVLGKEIYREIVSLLRPSKEVGEADPGELLKPHYNYLSGRLNKATYDLSDLFHKAGYRSLPLPSAGCPTDQRTLVAVFPYKHAAVTSGLGTIGRNGLLITEKFGPRVRLAAILTDAPMESTPVPKENFCDDCQACIDTCPAQALQPPEDDAFYAINKFACRTYRQTGLTCSMCIKACPKG